MTMNRSAPSEHQFLWQGLQEAGSNAYSTLCKTQPRPENTPAPHLFSVAAGSCVPRVFGAARALLAFSKSVARGQLIFALGELQNLQRRE